MTQISDRRTRDTAAIARKAPLPSPKIGLALGGGGARGLAHIAVLEAFDELGIKPAVMSGASIGALIGAAYASGMPAAEMRSYCRDALAKRTALLRHVYLRSKGRFWNLWKPRKTSIFSAELIFELVLPATLRDTFEALDIPFRVVATDFYTQSQYVLRSGPLMPAIAASSAVPALLTPVQLDGRILIDGGFVNPLPFDILRPEAEFVIAVDVSGGVDEPAGALPSAIDAVIGAQQIALRSIINEKLKASAPDVLIRPRVGHYRMLDFRRQEEILSAAAGAKEEVKRALEAHLSRVSP